MSNPYYNPSGTPANNSQVTSPAIRSEMALIQTGFDKLPLLSGKGLKLVRVNAGGTGLESVGSAVIVDGKTLTVDNSLELKGTDGTIIDINSVNNLDGAPYTPTISNLINCTLAPFGFKYMRVGSMMLVHGLLSGTFTAGANTLTTADISLPVASAFSLGYCGGSAFDVTNFVSGAMNNNTLQIRAAAAGSVAIQVLFMYVIQ